MFKVHTIGGYSEVGKNMTAIDMGEDIIVFDCGIHVSAIVDLQESTKNPTPKLLESVGALPNDVVLNNCRDKVRAIMITHAHLDHVGAVQYVAQKYPNAQIYGTPFTIQVLKALMADSKISLRNRINIVQPNTSIFVNGRNRKYKVDFISVSHSTLQTVFIALHSPYGIIVYANDYKLDNNPTIGDIPNYTKLREIARQGVKLLIVDSLYSGEERKTPSEKIARALVEEVLLTVNHENHGLIVTTFSSHIARLKSIVEFSKKLDRRLVFVGRSLAKYVNAAKAIKKCPFEREIELVSFSGHLKSKIKQIDKNRKDYVVVCTGHQGEPGSILDRLVSGKLPFTFHPQDSVVFSSSVIPVPVNISNRVNLDKKLRGKDVRVFDNVHVSILPNTEVIINDSNGIKIKEINAISELEKQEMKVPAFDSNDLKIKWYDAFLVKHPYNGTIFNIKTKSGRSVSITSGHSLFKLEKGTLISEKGDNLKIGDYLAIPKKFSWYKEVQEINVEDYINLTNNHYKKSVTKLFYNNKPICDLNLKLDNNFAKLLGYYLAEGSAPRHISLVIGKHENDILQEIKKSIKSSFPYANITVIEKGTSYEIVFGARILKSLFKSWFGNNAKTKKIPKFVFSSSDEFKLNFLGAYINGDGCIDKGKDHFRIRMKTASKKLASDLLYLFSQTGICAKFDHIQINPKRKIAGNNKFTDKTYSYVIRIQGIDYLNKLKNFLSDKFKIQIEEKSKTLKFSQNMPPESLPIEKLEFDEIIPKKDTYLWDIKYYRQNSKVKKQHISQKLIIKQADSVIGFTKKILNGDLLFDPIVKIEESNYKGEVFDFSVPKAENFIGGFGGLMLHNSGHGGREDLREVINLLQPEHIIPSHGSLDQLTPAIELAKEMGYKFGKNCHLPQDGSKIIIN